MLTVYVCRYCRRKENGDYYNVPVCEATHYLVSRAGCSELVKCFNTMSEVNEFVAAERRRELEEIRKVYPDDRYTVFVDGGTQ